MLFMYHFCYSKCAGGMLVVAMPNFALLCNELNHLLIYVLIMYGRNYIILCYVDVCMSMVGTK